MPAPCPTSSPRRRVAAIRHAALTLSALLMAACSGDVGKTAGETAAALDTSLAPGYAAITADDLMAHTRALADDSPEGRAPASPGEEKTVRYLEHQFRQLGLVGGMPGGAFVQNVTLVRAVPHPEASFHMGSRVLPLSHPADYLVRSRREQPLIEVDAEMVFVGYGVDAPAYGWNDFKNVDVKGKGARDAHQRSGGAGSA